MAILVHASDVFNTFGRIIMHRIMLALAVVALGYSAAGADGFTPRSSSMAASTTRPVVCQLSGHGQGSYVTHELDMGGLSIDSLGQAAFGFGLGTGCDLVMVTGWFIGAHVDYTWDRADFKATAGGTELMRLPFGNQFSAVARAGVVASNGNKVYGLLGETWGQGQSGKMGLTTLNFEGPRGLTYGGGVQIPLGGASGVSLIGGLEYRHVEFDKDSMLGIAKDTRENIIRAKVGLEF